MKTYPPPSRDTTAENICIELVALGLRVINVREMTDTGAIPQGSNQIVNLPLFRTIPYHTHTKRKVERNFRVVKRQSYYYKGQGIQNSDRSYTV